ncbi:MAG: 4-oxalocrotonate tautomerase [Burkholderiales bacterium]|nr:4-oxalocrotonate tautomerase [Burkholderiales bacterium]
MPSIRVEMFEGRSVDQKRALAKELTEATVRALGVPADSVDVMMFDIPRHDWATAGLLWSERKPTVPAAT